MADAIVVVDTSVLLSAGRTALYSFGTRDVVIPLVVLRELESKKSDPEIGLAARSALRELDSLRAKGDLRAGVDLGDDYGMLRIETNHIEHQPVELRKYVGGSDKTLSNDIRIISVAHALSENNTVTISTKDLPLKILASIVGVESEEFTPSNISDDFIDETTVYVVDDSVIDELYANGTVKLDLDVPLNVGVNLRSSSDDKKTAIAIAGKNYTFKKIENHRISGIQSRSMEQALAINYLMDDSIKIVSLGGRAGTGKTTLALAAAVEQQKKGYKKIIVFRSMHAVGGEELGFLPGTEAEKMDPWTQAIYDSLGSFLESSQIKYLKDHNIIQVLPLTHIRGRTFDNAFILIDEAQNLERATILTALSRLGKNSKAVMSWDVSQRDNFRVGRHDGVYEVTNRLMGEKLFAHTSLQKSERSDVAELVSRALDDFDLK